MIGNLTRNLDLTETLLNSIHLFLQEKANFFYNQLRYTPFFFSDRAGKIKMRFHFVQVERESAGHSPLDSKLVSVLCHFGNFGCGDGGWTPAMKMDGNKVKHLCTFFLSLATRVEKMCYN